MRRANDKSQFTPLGLWIQEYVPQAFSVTNLDYVIEAYNQERFMLVEEKQNGSRLHTAQRMTFAVLDEYLAERCRDGEYEYWGFYEVRLAEDTTFVGPGMKLNGIDITVEQLQRHLSFQDRVVPPYQFEWRKNHNT